MLCSAGTAMVAAMNTIATTSMASANRFCSHHERQRKW